MQRKGRGKSRPLVREAAKARIRSLYSEAFIRAREGDLVLARRYLELARKVGMRHTVRIPPDLKRATCRRCMTPLIPDRTSRVRLRKGMQVITCLECGHVSRYRIRGDDEDGPD